MKPIQIPNQFQTYQAIALGPMTWVVNATYEPKRGRKQHEKYNACFLINREGARRLSPGYAFLKNRFVRLDPRPWFHWISLNDRPLYVKADGTLIDAHPDLEDVVVLAGPALNFHVFYNKLYLVRAGSHEYICVSMEDTDITATGMSRDGLSFLVAHGPRIYILDNPFAN
jgi:hypothetical protein